MKQDSIDIQVKNRRIGTNQPAYIIAEMSGNHAGELSRALEIIHAAKASGADCIKIQTYTPDTLTIDCSNQYFMVKNGTWGGENLYQLYGKAYTPWEWQPRLKEEADRVGIDFLSTPFDTTSVDFLEELGLEFYKIASFEIVDLPLLRYVAKKMKPMIISTGMATVEEIKEALEAIYEQGNHQVALLRCQSAYPADPSQMNLQTILDMASRFRVPIGLSDHSIGSLSATTAVAMGACIIEKHFCISRDIDNPDASFSMTPQEFSKMVQDVREVEAAKGDLHYGITEEEKSSIVFRRSIFITKDTEAGTALNKENMRIIRPGYGLKPKYYSDIYGQQLAVNLKRGTPLSWDAFAKGKILFLSNNDNTLPLYRWLCDTEGAENVMHVKNKLTAQMMEALQPSFIISYNYKHIIPQEILDTVHGGCINLHTSYLPYNRGSAPNFFSFYDQTPKGVTIHELAAGLDAGRILCRRELHFDEEKETFASTYRQLIQAMNELFMENWAALREGSVEGVEQEKNSGTYHTVAQLHQISDQFPFSWDENIAEVLHRMSRF